MAIQPTKLERCSVRNKRLESKCILRKGHVGKHAFPNLHFKKTSPDVFEILKKRTWGIHENTSLIQGNDLITMQEEIKD